QPEGKTVGPRRLELGRGSRRALEVHVGPWIWKYIGRRAATGPIGDAAPRSPAARGLRFAQPSRHRELITMTSLAATRAVAWRGRERIRVEAAHATLGARRLVARGTSTAAGYAVDWILETGPAWVTRSLSVRARGAGWARSLELGRDDDGEWSAVHRAD